MYSVKSNLALHRDISTGIVYLRILLVRVQAVASVVEVMTTTRATAERDRSILGYYGISREGQHRILNLTTISLTKLARSCSTTVDILRQKSEFRLTNQSIVDNVGILINRYPSLTHPPYNIKFDLKKKFFFQV